MRFQVCFLVTLTNIAILSGGDHRVEQPTEVLPLALEKDSIFAEDLFSRLEFSEWNSPFLWVKLPFQVHLFQISPMRVWAPGRSKGR